MAIHSKDGIEFEGCVYAEKEHMWADGMLEINVACWDMENHKTVIKEVGYYGIDGTNLAGCTWEIDLKPEVARDMIRTAKWDANFAFEKEVTRYKNKIEKGRRVKIVRGRKVPKGTELNCFWVGECLTYAGRVYGTNEKDMIAGCKDDNGEKYWIKVDYLKNITEIKSPRSKDRREFIKNVIKRRFGHYVVETAAGRNGGEND